MTGEVEQVVGVDEHGKPVLGRPRIRDRLYAGKLLIEHGYGKPPKDLQIDDAKTRPTGEALEQRVRELLPRVIALLSPVDRKQVVELLERDLEIEVLVQGKEAAR